MPGQLGIENDPRDQFRRGLQLRVVAAGSLLVLLGLFTWTGVGYPFEKAALAYLCLVGLIALNGAYWAVGARRGFPLKDFYWHWSLDLLLILGVVEGLGGPEVSSAILGFVLIVITSGIFISRMASLGVAIAGCFLFGAHSTWSKTLQGMGPEEIFVASGSMLLLVLIAYITGTLGDDIRDAASRLWRQHREIVAQNRELRELRAAMEFQSHVLTHDIRGPMSAASECLTEVELDLDDEAFETVGQLLDAARRNLKLVHEMIDALDEARRLEGGGGTPGGSEVTLGDVWSDLKPEFEGLIGEAEADVCCSGGEVQLNMPRHHAQVMLRNLVRNALRFVPEGGRGIVGIGCVEEKGAVRLYVEDNGPGVREEDRERIFEMFQKGPGTRGGLGIGLALVKRIAESLNGNVQVGTGSRGGARFVVEWPTGQPDAPAKIVK